MIKIYIQRQNPLKDVVDFYIVEKSEFDSKRYLVSFTPKGNLRKEIKEGDAYQPTPTFSLSGYDAGQTMKALADAIAEQGIKTDEDKKREGKLEAIEKHLADMRNLVFKEIK